MKEYPCRAGCRTLPVLLVLTTLLGGTQITAAEPVSFELHASTSTALIGTPVAIEGVVKYPIGAQISFNKEGQKTDPFVVKDVQLGQPQAQGGMQNQPVRLQAIPFDIGSLTFPILQWTLTDASGATQTIQSPSVKLEVTGPDTRSSDIRDIKGPLHPPFWLLLIIILLAIATLALVGYEAQGFLKPQKEGQRGKAAVQKLPHEEAIDELEGLRESSLSVREIYDRLSDVVRVYFERRFEIPALVLTTSDLLRMMRQAEIDRPVIGLAKDLFARCDLVKFAKLVPEAPELRQDIEMAIQIVKTTAPKPPAIQQAISVKT